MRAANFKSSVDARRPYEAPSLTIFGSVRELTGTKSVRSTDAATKNLA